jgi:hypothetical protein
MNTRRIPLIVVVLAVTVGCAWAAPETSGTAGFTAVPDSEVAQIVGGDGYVCDLDNALWPEDDQPCFDNGHNPPTGCGTGSWSYLMPRYGCVEAESGECYLYYMVFYEFGDCGWYPENGGCVGTSAYFECGWFCG